MPELLDGRATSDLIKKELAEEIASMSRMPHLVTVQVGDNPASTTYLRLKHRDAGGIRIRSTPMELGHMTTQDQLFGVIDELNVDDDVDGFIVQTPLPEHIDEDAVMERMNPEKDVDGLHPLNWGRLMAGKPRFVSATPGAILELLERYKIQVSGAVVGIAGRGMTVGRPLSVLLSLKGTDSTVVLCHSRTRDLAGELKRCDIVVAAMGQPGMITSEHIKAGAVVVDVGQVAGPDGRMAGDVDRASVDPVAAWISPTPGGVGPMTRVMLLKNVVKAAQSRPDR